MAETPGINPDALEPSADAGNRSKKKETIRERIERLEAPLGEAKRIKEAGARVRDEQARERYRKAHEGQSESEQRRVELTRERDRAEEELRQRMDELYAVKEGAERERAVEKGKSSVEMWNVRFGLAKQGVEDAQKKLEKNIKKIEAWAEKHPMVAFLAIYVATAPFKMGVWFLKKMDHGIDWGLKKVEDWGEKNAPKPLVWAFNWMLWPIEKFAGRQTDLQADVDAKGARADKKEAERFEKKQRGKKK